MGIRLGRFTFDLAAHSLWAGDVPVRLPRKALDVLAKNIESEYGSLHVLWGDVLR